MSLADVRWIALDHSDDARGTLTALEETALPFPIRRIFYMHRVPRGRERGAHAHRHTHQAVIAVAGRFTIDVSDGTETRTFRMDDPNRCLYLPPMTWVGLYDFDETTVALVLCDRAYEPQHVIRSREEYNRLLLDASPA
jgi:dTDP-4-dehydrorhamnose 3,5-epimerase-like enzyme